MSEKSAEEVGDVESSQAGRASRFQLAHLTYSILIVAWIETAYVVIWAFRLKPLSPWSATSDGVSFTPESVLTMVVFLLAGRGSPFFLMAYAGLNWAIHSVVQQDIGRGRTWRTWLGLLASMFLIVVPFAMFPLVASVYNTCFRELIPNRP
jgi:hypothetical protein